jgi:hypothetical protein
VMLEAVDFDDEESCEACKLWFTLETKAELSAKDSTFIH